MRSEVNAGSWADCWSRRVALDLCHHDKETLSLTDIAPLSLHCKYQTLDATTYMIYRLQPFGHIKTDQQACAV